MALSKLTTDMNIVSALPSEPNDVGGLTDEELKAKFDEGPNAIKAYINDTLTAEIDEQKATKAEVQGIVLGQILDGTITTEKFSNSFVMPIAKGGTGATTPEAARANLGVVNILTGTTAPTSATVGTIGQFYLNTTTGRVYECIAISGTVYTWKDLTKSSEETVLDVGRNKLIKVKTDITTFGTYIINLCPSMSGQNGGFWASSMIRIGDILFACGYSSKYVSSYYMYYVRLVAVNLATNTLIWDSYEALNVDNNAIKENQVYIADMGYCNDANIVRCMYGSQYLIADVANKTWGITDSTSYSGQAFGTTNYFGYLYQTSNSNRTFNYTIRAGGGAKGFSSTKSIGTAPYSYGNTQLLGSYGDILYYAEPVDATSWRVNKFDIATNTISYGVENYSDVGLNGIYSTITYGNRYVVCPIMKNSTGVYAVYVFDLQTGQSNYSTIVWDASTSSLNQNIFGYYYMGSDENYGYYVYNSVAYRLNRVTKKVDSCFTVDIGTSEYSQPGGVCTRHEIVSSTGMLFMGLFKLNIGAGTMSRLYSTDTIVHSTNYVSGNFISKNPPSRFISRVYGPSNDFSALAISNMQLNSGYTYHTATLLGNSSINNIVGIVDA